MIQERLSTLEDRMGTAVDMPRLQDSGTSDSGSRAQDEILTALGARQDGQEQRLVRLAEENCSLQAELEKLRTSSPNDDCTREWDKRFEQLRTYITRSTSELSRWADGVDRSLEEIRTANVAPITDDSDGLHQDPLTPEFLSATTLTR